MSEWSTVTVGNISYDHAEGHDFQVRPTRRGFSAVCPACGKRHRGGIEPGWLSGKRAYYVSCGERMFAIPLAQIEAARKARRALAAADAALADGADAG